jgi:hypothetical protein
VEPGRPGSGHAKTLGRDRLAAAAPAWLEARTAARDNALVRNSVVLSPAGQERLAAALPCLRYLQIPEAPGISPDMSILETLDIVNAKLELAGEEPIVFDHDSLPVSKEEAELSMAAAACIGCGACVAMRADISVSMRSRSVSWVAATRGQR